VSGINVPGTRNEIKRRNKVMSDRLLRAAKLAHGVMKKSWEPCGDADCKGMRCWDQEHRAFSQLEQAIEAERTNAY